jgi:hypothetical protein
MFSAREKAQKEWAGKSDGHELTLAHIFAPVDSSFSGLDGIVKDSELLLYRKCGFVEGGRERLFIRL